jgi:hypothetical protein
MARCVSRDASAAVNIALQRDVRNTASALLRNVTDTCALFSISPNQLSAALSRVASKHSPATKCTTSGIGTTRVSSKFMARDRLCKTLASPNNSKMQLAAARALFDATHNASTQSRAARSSNADAKFATRMALNDGNSLSNELTHLRAAASLVDVVHNVQITVLKTLAAASSRRCAFSTNFATIGLMMRRALSALSAISSFSDFFASALTSDASIAVVNKEISDMYCALLQSSRNTC